MPTYSYRAKDRSAKTVNGQIFAVNQDEAIEKIIQQGLLPVSVEEGLPPREGVRPVVSRRIRSKDIYLFSRQLATMIKAGVPIIRALHIIAQQEHNQQLKDILQSFSDGIKNGRALSDCMTDYPKVFTPFYVAMVRVGEEGGHLKEILMQVADYQRTQEELYSKVRTALAYPVLMFVVGTATVVFILTFIMPKITRLFSTMSETLPGITLFLMKVSSLLQNSWYWLLLAVVALGFAVRRWMATPTGRTAISSLQLRLPLVGPMVLKAEMARFCRTLGLLLHSGISLIRAIRITIPVLNNAVVREELAKSIDRLEGGITFGDSLRQSPLVPTIVSNIVTVGEESGSLESTLADVAESYEQDTAEAIKTMTTLLEPAMILAVGLVVGFIVIAMLLPVFQIDILAQ